MINIDIKISYARAQGENHKIHNKSCEDYVDGIVLNQSSAVLVLSDGGGSKKYALETAELLCNKIIELFINDADFINISKEKLVKALNSASLSSNMPINEMGATLLFVAVKDGEYFAGHIGDGVIIKGLNEEFSVLSEPENGEFANITYFLPNLTNEEKHMRLYNGTVNKKLSFILASDGISDLLYESDTFKGAKICNKIDNWNRELSSDECSKIMHDNLENILSEYTSDDMSLAIISLT